MDKRIIFLALVLAAMGCVASSPNAPPIKVTTLFQNWTVVAVLLLTISLIIMLLAYIFGNILMNDRIKVWAKIELFEIIYSIIILALALYAVNAANDVVQSLVKGSDPYTDCICDKDNFQQIEGSIYYRIDECHIRLSLYFLSTIFSEANQMNSNTYISYIITSTIADAQKNIENIYEMSGMFQWTPWRGFLVMGNTVKGDVFEKYVFIMTLIMFQEVLVRFIATTLYPVMFVMGVILRTFTFTRKLGGLLMAIALSLFFIYPMFYAFGALLINQIKMSNMSPEDPNPSIAARMYVEGKVPMLGYKDADGGLGTLDTGEELRAAKNIVEEVDTTTVCGNDLKITVRKPLEKSVNDAKEATKDFGFNLYEKQDGASVENIYDPLGENANEWFGEVSKKNWYDGPVVDLFKQGGYIDILSRLAFFSVFFGLLGIMATIAAIKNLSVFFGGDTEIAGLTHLI